MEFYLNSDKEVVKIKKFWTKGKKIIVGSFLLGTTLGSSIVLNVYQRTQYEKLYEMYGENIMTLKGMFSNGDYGVKFSHYIEDIEGIRTVIYTDGTKALYDTINDKYILYPKEYEPLKVEFDNKEELDKQIEKYIDNVKHNRKIRLR